jgi:hypothetical protein
MSNDEELREALLSSAVINIKKSNGRSSSEDEEFKEFARLDGDVLKRQVSLIDPEFVICGHTWKFVFHLWPEARKAGEWKHRIGTLVFVDFWHPASIAHAIRKKHYDLLNSWIRESLPDTATNVP